MEWGFGRVTGFRTELYAFRMHSVNYSYTLRLIGNPPAKEDKHSEAGDGAGHRLWLGNKRELSRVHVRCWEYNEGEGQIRSNP